MKDLINIKKNLHDFQRNQDLIKISKNFKKKQ
jgi:hypothetical protein